jgi:arylsulfatase A-like enzyme
MANVKTPTTVFLLIILVIIVGLIFRKPRDPNIILIVVDDLGYADMSCTGLSYDVRTPNIDRLARSGIRFTQAYATSPICSPSRAAIITGCYQQRWGTYWYGGPGLHDERYPTIAEILKEDGYVTGYIGKVHYGSHDADTSHRSFPLNHGFDYFLGHTSARKHYFNHMQAIEDSFNLLRQVYDRKGQSLRQQPLWHNFDKAETIEFTTTMFGNQAMDFIETYRHKKFFLQLSFNAVHNFTHQLPETYLQSKGLKGYHDWDPSKEEYYEWYRAGRKPYNPEGREHYLGQLYYLDRAIGEVLDYVKSQGLQRRTLIIFISDNGGSTPIYARNYPLRGSKYVLYEGGIRVPMIISYPGEYPEGRVSDNLVSALDILPTVVSEANCQVPGHIDGIDLGPLLLGEDPRLQHKALFWDTRQETAARTGIYKLRTASDDANAKYEMVELELGEFLYDLEQDIGERVNLKDSLPQTYRDLEREFNNWRVRVNGER